MSLDTKEKIEKRKELIADNCRTRAVKARAQDAYGGAHREIRRSVRRDKAKIAEEAAEKRNMKDLYIVAQRNLQGIKKPVKDKQ